MNSSQVFDAFWYSSATALYHQMFVKYFIFLWRGTPIKLNLPNFLKRLYDFLPQILTDFTSLIIIIFHTTRHKHLMKHFWKRYLIFFLNNFQTVFLIWKKWYALTVDMPINVTLVDMSTVNANALHFFSNQSTKSTIDETIVGRIIWNKTCDSSIKEFLSSILVY